MNCPKCEEPIVMGRLKSGVEIALSPKPRPDGIVLLVGEHAAFLTGAALMTARKTGMPVHTRHGITCKAFWRQVDREKYNGNH